MRIAFDVDGVITNLQKFEIEEGRKIFNDNKKSVNKSYLKFQDLFSCTEKEESDFWLKSIWKYSLSEMPRAGIAEEIRRLKDQNHEIFLITARVHTTRNDALGLLFRKMLLHWLKKNDIKYDHIIYCNEKTSDIEKTVACIENDIDLIIDDEPKNIRALQEVTNVGVMQETYNKECSGENTYMINSPKEIQNIVSKITEDKLVYCKEVK